MESMKFVLYNGNMIKYFVASYMIFACIDSYASEHSKCRICKVFLVPLLITMLLVEGKHEGYLYLALVFCWIGDLFLIHKTERNQMIGTFSFLIGHIFYSLYFFNIHTFMQFRSFLYFLPYLLTIIIYLKKTYVLIPKKFCIPSLIYLFIITFMSYSAFLQYIDQFSLSTFITWCGTVFFLISDCLISRQMFLKQKQKWVMQTYSLAQLLIIAGVLYGTSL